MISGLSDQGPKVLAFDSLQALEPKQREQGRHVVLRPQESRDAPPDERPDRMPNRERRAGHRRCQQSRCLLHAAKFPDMRSVVATVDDDRVVFGTDLMDLLKELAHPTVGIGYLACIQSPD